ncbi:protein of unknown function [Xenorhabdus doucetiae]|uniref:Uncharacterized protein n=1 Tax=Xenorhabdus doucetiae TaxID=351671 RepID=A0A068QM41_9GAMM|nr:protein of unknown function [Xenorhabdus doucetiae]
MLSLILLAARINGCEISLLAITRYSYNGVPGWFWLYFSRKVGMVSSKVGESGSRYINGGVINGEVINGELISGVTDGASAAADNGKPMPKAINIVTSSLFMSVFILLLTELNPGKTASTQLENHWKRVHDITTMGIFIQRPNWTTGVLDRHRHLFRFDLYPPDTAWHEYPPDKLCGGGYCFAIVSNGGDFFEASA